MQGQLKALTADEREKLLDERHRGIKHIEHQTEDVHDIFQQLDQIVIDQNKPLDIIEYNISQAGDYTQKGNVELGTADEELEKHNSTCCWILIVLALMLLMVIIIIMIEKS